MNSQRVTLCGVIALAYATLVASVPMSASAQDASMAILFPDVKSLTANCVRGRISDECAQYAAVQAGEASNIRSGSRADYAAFYDSLGAQTPSCQGMIGTLVIVMSASSVGLIDNSAEIIGAHGEPGGLIEWAKAANAAKVCASDVSAAGDVAARRLPISVNKTACTFLKEGFAYSKTAKDDSLPMLEAQTSWACGWPSPVSGYRPVPGLLPP